MMPRMKRHGANMLWKGGACEELEGGMKERWNEAATGQRIKTDLFTHMHARTNKNAFHTTVLLHKNCHRKKSHTKAFTHFYAQTLLQTDTLTNKRISTQTLLHAKRFYTQNSLHTDAFTKLLHTEAFTHKRFYSQTSLQTEAFTHRNLYTQRFYAQSAL